MLILSDKNGLDWLRLFLVLLEVMMLPKVLLYKKELFKIVSLFPLNELTSFIILIVLLVIYKVVELFNKLILFFKF